MENAIENVLIPIKTVEEIVDHLLSLSASEVYNKQESEELADLTLVLEDYIKAVEAHEKGVDEVCKHLINNTRKV